MPQTLLQTADPAATNATTLSTFKSRALGALLGVHAGDSLGATLEFTDYTTARRHYPNGLRDIVGGGVFKWPVGYPTDDTDLTRAVLLAHRDAVVDGVEDLPKAAGQHMLDWLHGRWPGRKIGSSPKDIGGATRTGLTRFRKTRNPQQAGSGINSAGNGSLMRCISTGVFEGDASQRRELSILISSVTHDDPRCTVACATYNDIVAALVRGAPRHEALQVGLKLAGTMDSTDGQSVLRALEKGARVDLRKVARENPIPLVGECRGYVLHSVTLAIAALMDERGIEDILADIASIGADADTNCAIAGGLVGARDGVESIPEEWLSRLRFREEFQSIVEEMVEALKC